MCKGEEEKGPERPRGVQLGLLDILTACGLTRSNNTTRPPRSPVAKCRPSWSNSTAEMMSAAGKQGNQVLVLQMLGLGDAFWAQ